MMSEEMTKQELMETIVKKQILLDKVSARINELEGLMDSGQLIGRNEVLVAHAAKMAHEVNRAYCQHLGDDSQVPWSKAPEHVQQSAINGVLNLQLNPQFGPAEMHTRWCKFKKDDGWKHGEKKDENEKTHPCLVPYSDLPAEQQLKDKLFAAVVRTFLNLSEVA